MKAKCSQCHCIKIVQNHHIVAKADGGDNETTFLCRRCHLRLHRRNGDFRRWTLDGTLILKRLTQKDTVNINGKQVEQDKRN